MLRLIVKPVDWFTKGKNECNLYYIPSHLHWNNRPIINSFYPNESIYRRIPKTASNEVPFASISLIDLSFNRSGEEKIKLSDKEDVLWNIDPAQSEKFQRFDWNITTIKVKKLDLKIKDEKTIILEGDEIKTDNDKVISTLMRLVHEPEICNYSHSMIIFEVNNKRVSFNNYEETLGSNSYKRLRAKCKKILHDAILRENISFP